MKLLRIRRVTTMPGFRLKLTLTDDTVVERDISALLDGPLFGDLRDGGSFAKVRVAGGAIEWPNGADICPDLLIWGGLPPEEPEVRPPADLVLTRKHLS